MGLELIKFITGVTWREIRASKNTLKFPPGCTSYLINADGTVPVNPKTMEVTSCVPGDEVPRPNCGYARVLRKGKIICVDAGGKEVPPL